MVQGSLLHEFVKTFRLPGNLAKTTVMPTPPELALFISDIQRVTPGGRLTMFVPQQRFPAAIGTDNLSKLTGVVQLATGELTFRVHTVQELPEAVICEAGHAAGTVCALRQHPLAVPLQQYFVAAGVGDAVMQRLFIVRIMIRGGMIQRVGIR